MQWPRPLLALWRKAFPVRYVLVYRMAETNIPPAIGDDGEALGMDDMLPELVEAYSTCTPVFTWLGREIARREKEYHALKPHKPEERAVWLAQIETLNGQIAALNRVMRIPLIANRRIMQLRELAEKKKATEAELKALEDYLTE